MVAGFHRSFSLPGSPRLKTRPATENPRHARSVSLPGRSQRHISQLNDRIGSLAAWQSTQPESASASWICDGLARLRLLQASLDDLLALPDNQDHLRAGSGSEWAERVLDNFLRLADAHSSLRSEIVTIHEHHSAAQIAIRRKDSHSLALSIAAMKKTEKQFLKLASSLKEVVRSSPRATHLAELAGVVAEVIHVTAAASASVILGFAAVCSAASASATALSTAKNSSCWTSLRSDVSERLEEAEGCIAAVKASNERLFRCLVNGRVSLLNTMGR